MRAKARVGTTLRSKWHLDVLLGVGGMAAVYAATHRNGTRAAIKVLHPELSAHGHVRARFFREGRAANAIQHDGAVKVLDEDEDERGGVYLVMELLDGESLDARAARAGGKLPLDEVLAAADQLLDVLVAAHDKGVIHRDLKPENVFLTRDGRVMVLDFGIARLREVSTQSHATRDGLTMGTPAFMAPEQARGLWDEVDARVDLWAVGATMFTLMSGRPVHEGRTTNEVLVAAVTQKAPPLAAVVPGVPAPVAELVDRALAFEKADRWPSAGAMQNALRHAFHAMRGEPISTHPKLSVPPTVPNRTLPSADLAPPVMGTQGTGPAVASGSTGVPLRSGAAPDIPRVALLAGGAIAGIGFLALVVIVVSVAATRSSATPTASAAAAGLTPAPALGSAMDQHPDAGIRTKPSSEAPGVISVDDLPTAPSSSASKPKPKLPFKPLPAPKPVATSWKDQRL